MKIEKVRALAKADGFVQVQTGFGVMDLDEFGTPCDEPKFLPAPPPGYNDGWAYVRLRYSPDNGRLAEIANIAENAVWGLFVEDNEADNDLIDKLWPELKAANYEQS